MMRSLALALVVSFPLLASAGPKTKPKDAGQPAAEPAPAKPAEPKAVKLAAPGLTAVNVDEKVATFFSDHFAQQLALGGLAVISASEIQALLGFERSKQLMGCSDGSQSCMAELGGALGVDGIVTGSIGKFGGTSQANIKILQAGNGQALSIISRKASSDEEMLNALTDAAQQAVADVFQKLGRAPVQVAAADPRRGSDGGGRAEMSSGQNEGIARPQPPGSLRHHHTFSLLGGVNWFVAAGAAPMGGTLAVQYEPLFTPSLSALIVPYGSFGFDASGGALIFGLGLSLRWYTSGTAPGGPWVAPGVRLFLGAGSTGTFTYGAMSAAPSLSVGYSLVLGGLVLSAGASAELYFMDQNVVMFVPGLIANLGLAF